MARWVVTRIVKERYDVEAETREQALNEAVDPFSVEIVKETAKRRRVKDSEGRKEVKRVEKE